MDAIYVALKEKGRPLSSFKKGDTTNGYTLSEEPGQNMAFKPALTPGEILAFGAFEGKYLNDRYLEFPAEWFLRAGALGKLHPEGPDPQINLFKINLHLITVS